MVKGMMRMMENGGMLYTEKKHFIDMPVAEIISMCADKGNHDGAWTVRTHEFGLLCVFHYQVPAIMLGSGSIPYEVFYLLPGVTIKDCLKTLHLEATAQRLDEPQVSVYAVKDSTRIDAVGTIHV